MTITHLLQQLQQATGPEDIFGPLTHRSQDDLRRVFRQWARRTHPDHHPDDVGAATEAFQHLQRWHAVAQQRLEHAAGSAITIQSAQRTYVATPCGLGGDLADFYTAVSTPHHFLLKISRHPQNNDLLETEARHLQQLDQWLTNDPLRAHFATLNEHFMVRDGAGHLRQVNVLAHETGYVSLAEVMRGYPTGIEAADMAWMFNRLLAALGTLHAHGLVHGAIVPAHLLLRLSDHNGLLIDFAYSVPLGQPIKAISPPHWAFYPPEVLQKRPSSPATDLFMAARCMKRLLGKTAVPRPIDALLQSCLLASPHRRANDAWELFDQFQEILRRLYGAPQFRPFPLNGQTAV